MASSLRRSRKNSSPRSQTYSSRRGGTPRPSATTLNLDDAAIPVADPDAAIPAVDDAAIPGVDDVELPGVDGDVHTPDNVEITDLETTTNAPIFEAEAEELEAAPVEPAEQQAAPVEPAPVAQPAETNEARTPTQTAPQ